MDQYKSLYSDKLVDLYFDRLILKNYYFPSGKGKEILLTDISSFEVLPPTIVNGKYRIWGSGNFAIWFPLDSNRSRRSKIFRIKLHSQRIQAAFTVEHSDEFELQLKNIEIIK